MATKASGTAGLCCCASYSPGWKYRAELSLWGDFGVGDTMNNNQTGEKFFSRYHQSQICKLQSVRKLSYGWPIKDADFKTAAPL